MVSTNIEGKLLKAKIELMGKSAFISTIALSLQHVFTDKVPTAGVDGITIFYNRKFVEKLSTPQFAGLIAHECWHVAFQHISRRGGRKKVAWNVAGDYVINYALITAGFEIPKEGLYNSKYDGTWSTDAVYEDIKDTVFDAESLMLDIMETAEADKDENFDANIVDIIVRAHTQAQINGEHLAGKIPQEILRVIDKLLNPRVPWPVVLNRFLTRQIKNIYSWSRRNRRYIHAHLPSMRGYGLGHLTFAIDTSGSQGKEELQSTLSEIQGIQRVFNPEKMTIIDCDARIHNVYEISANTDILSLKFHGNGGTDFQPVLDYVEKNPTQALVYFTDLYGNTDLKEVNYPVLWICNSTHEPASIGETVYID